MSHFGFELPINHYKAAFKTHGELNTTNRYRISICVPKLLTYCTRIHLIITPRYVRNGRD